MNEVISNADLNLQGREGECVMDKIGLIDVDGHNYPNLALMKISAWHKSQGDDVEWWWGWGHYDRVYKSKVFDETYTKDIDDPMNADEIIKGGTGYGLDNKLPEEIERMCPDYSIYPQYTKDKAYGFLTRGCPNNCPFCIVSSKEGRKSCKVADIDQWWSGQKEIILCDPNLLACKDHIELLGQLAESKAWIDINQGVDARLLTEQNIDLLNKLKIKNIHFAWDLMDRSESVLRGLDLYRQIGKKTQHGSHGTVYVLTNFNTTMEENLYRIYKLREKNYNPYVMIYDKPHAPKEVRMLQRWCNNKIIFKSTHRFEDYDPRRG